MEADGIDMIVGGHDHQPMALFHNGVLVFKCGGQNGNWVGAVTWFWRII
jgi:2',3'-cyclic-nucleotide 2'-phosphodiesterase (5'-nucleotidase family)